MVLKGIIIAAQYYTHVHDGLCVVIIDIKQKLYYLTPKALIASIRLFIKAQEIYCGPYGISFAVPPTDRPQSIMLKNLPNMLLGIS